MLFFRNLGLRRVDLSSSELSRQRDELEQMRAGLSQQMKQRQLALIRQEELRIQARVNILPKKNIDFVLGQAKIVKKSKLRETSMKFKLLWHLEGLKKDSFLIKHPFL